MFSQKAKRKTQAHTGPLLPLAKQTKNNNNNTSTTRENGCGVERRGNIHSSKHMVCCWPPADHQMWDDYMTVVRLAAKHTNQPSWLQTTLKSLELIQPYISFSFLCFFPILIIIIIIFLWTESESVTFAGETGSRKQCICDPCYLISQWGAGRGCCRQPCVCVCAVRMCIMCVCVCKREQESTEQLLHCF